MDTTLLRALANFYVSWWMLLYAKTERKDYLQALAQKYAKPLAAIVLRMAEENLQTKVVKPLHSGDIGKDGGMYLLSKLQDHVSAYRSNPSLRNVDTLVNWLHQFSQFDKEPFEQTASKQGVHEFMPYLAEDVKKTLDAVAGYLEGNMGLPSELDEPRRGVAKILKKHVRKIVEPFTLGRIARPIGRGLYAAIGEEGSGWNPSKIDLVLFPVSHKRVRFYGVSQKGIDVLQSAMKEALRRDAPNSVKDIQPGSDVAKILSSKFQDVQIGSDTDKVLRYVIVQQAKGGKLSGKYFNTEQDALAALEPQEKQEPAAEGEQPSETGEQTAEPAVQKQPQRRMLDVMGYPVQQGDSQVAWFKGLTRTGNDVMTTLVSAFGNGEGTQTQSVEAVPGVIAAESGYIGVLIGSEAYQKVVMYLGARQRASDPKEAVSSRWFNSYQEAESYLNWKRGALRRAERRAKLADDDTFHKSEVWR